MNQLVLQQLDGEAAVLDQAVGLFAISFVERDILTKRRRARPYQQRNGHCDHEFDQRQPAARSMSRWPARGRRGDWSVLVVMSVGNAHNGGNDAAAAVGGAIGAGRTGRAIVEVWRRKQCLPAARNRRQPCHTTVTMYSLLVVGVSLSTQPRAANIAPTLLATTNFRHT